MSASIPQTYFQLLDERKSNVFNVVIAILAIAIGSFGVYKDLWFLPLALGGSVLGTIAVVRYPMVWILSLCGVMIPWLNAGTDTEVTALEIASVAYFWGTLGLWFFWQIFIRKEKLLRSGVDFAFAAFVVWLVLNGVVAIAAGTSPFLWFREWLLFTFILYYFPFRHYINTEKRLIAFFSGITVMTFILGLLNIRKYLAAMSDIQYAFEIFSNRVALNEDIFVSLSMLTFLLYLYAHTWKKKALFFTLFLFFVGSLLASFSRGFWVSFFFGLVAIFPLLGVRKSLKSVVMAVALLFVAYFAAITILGSKGQLAVEIIKDRFASVSKVSTDPSVNSRVVESRTLLELIEQQPLAGYGFGTKFTFYDPIIRAVRHTNFIHNGYISAMFKFGLIGSFLFYGIVVAIIIRGYKAAWNMPPSLWRIAIMTSTAVLLSMLLVNMTSAQISNRGSLFWFALFFALVEGGRKIAEQRSGNLTVK